MADPILVPMPDEKFGVPADHEAAAIRARLAELAAEQSQLEQVLHTLEAANRAVLPLSAAPSSAPVTRADKVALFLRLFAARRSVYPKFWENLKTGKKTVGQKPSIHEIRQASVDDPERAEQIAADILLPVQEGRCPLVLSDRKSQLEKPTAQYTSPEGASSERHGLWKNLALLADRLRRVHVHTNHAFPRQ